MANNQKRGIGLLLLQIALALYLAVTGLSMLGSGFSIKSIQATKAVHHIFSGNLAGIVAIALGVILLLCGVVLILRMFADTHRLDRLLKFVSLIAWIAIAVIIDIINFPGLSTEWTLNVAKDLLIIGGLMSIAD